MSDNTSKPFTPARAFVLAAGLGTRLRPISERVPKPAWPLFGAPLAAHVLHGLAGAGVREAIVNLHHLPEELQNALDGCIPEGMEVRWSLEEKILGTGGALKPWAARLCEDNSPVWLINADTYREFDLPAMATLHRREEPVATLALAPAKGKKAPIGIDADGRIVRFLDSKAPGLGDKEAAACDFAGVHLLGTKVLDEVAESGAEKFCINAEIHAGLIARGERYYGYLEEPAPYWSDLGTPVRYLSAHFELLEWGRLPNLAGGRLVLAEETTEDGGKVVPPSYVEQGSRVEAGAVAGPLAVLGRGAVVRSGATLTRAVAWAGADIGGDLSDKLITERGEQLGPDKGEG